MSNENLKKSTTRVALLDQAKQLATTPGVYLMKDVSKVIQYVGKAKNLKARVNSYFQPTVHEHPRTELMLQNVHDFEVILTETESEALVLECTLIKKYKPKFNVRLKDDKHYPYIKIPLDEDFARLEWTRKVEPASKKQTSRYFGPFPSGYSARIVLRLLTERFRLRDCSDNTFAHRSRPCILYQMDQCSAPCVAKISVDDYQHHLHEAIKVLEGKDKTLIKELTQEMQECASEERFEDAARIRDQIKSIELISETQSVSQEDKQLNRDVFAFERKTELGESHLAHGVVLQVRAGKLLSLKHYQLFNVEAATSDSQIMADFLAQHFLLNAPEENQTKAHSVLVKKSLIEALIADDRELLEKTLHIKITNPTNDAAKQLVNVAHANARYALENSKTGEGGHGFSALEEVQEKLGLDRLPRRIECYDISNTQGEDSVASRVVFIDGAPDKNLYRRYKIQTVTGPDDFKSMREVMDRRFSQMDLRSGDEKPDLVLIDGGKGQLAQAEAIFKDLNIQGVAIAGLAKARTENNFQSPEVESTFERIFLPNRVNPINLYPTTKAYKILTHLRDEAHRFALSYHRKLRDQVLK